MRSDVPRGRASRLQIRRRHAPADVLIAMALTCGPSLSIGDEPAKNTVSRTSTTPPRRRYSSRPTAQADGLWRVTAIGETDYCQSVPAYPRSVLRRRRGHRSSRPERPRASPVDIAAASRHDRINTIVHLENTYLYDVLLYSCMSKLLATITASTQRITKARRTIAHSPAFGADRTTDEAGRPATRIPPGGFLTG